MHDPELMLAGACLLDHDGCVVCSDAGIPLRVISLAGDDARCVDAEGAEAIIATELVQPVEIGDILLTHGGVAIARAAINTNDGASPLSQHGRGAGGEGTAPR